MSFLVELNCSLEDNRTTCSLQFSQCSFFLLKKVKRKSTFFTHCVQVFSGLYWVLVEKNSTWNLGFQLSFPFALLELFLFLSVFSIFLLFPGFDLHFPHSRDVFLLSIQGLIICFKCDCQYTLLSKAMK